MNCFKFWKQINLLLKTFYSKSMSYCYFNGDIIPFADCNVHISDLQIQRGYGIFDYFRAKNGYVQWLDDYMDRFFNSLLISEFEINLTRNDIKSILDELQKKNNIEESGFKIMVTGGYSDDLGSVTGKPNIFLLNFSFTKSAESLVNNGTNLITCNYVRPFAEVKTLNYFTSLRLHKKKNEFKAADVLYHDNFFSETSRGNVFFIKGETIYTPKNNILKGITRKHILEMTPSIRVEDIPFESLFDFDEIFISSSNKDILPVTKIDGKSIGDGKVGQITKELISSFEKVRFS